MKFSSKNILVLLLLIFIIFDINPPMFVTTVFNNILGKILLFALSISLFKFGPLVGSLALVSSYLLLIRSNNLVSLDVNTYIPSEEKRTEFFQNTPKNKFPKTLEEQVVSDDVPLIKDFPIMDSSFIPVINYTHDALTV